MDSNQAVNQPCDEGDTNNDKTFEYSRKLHNGKNETLGFPITIEYAGHKFICLKNVFNAVGHDIFATGLPPTTNGDFLEIGTGTGCVAASYYLKHKECTRRLVATDINPVAVRNAQLNFDTHNVPGEVFQSDLFENVPTKSKFDIIFWNVPFFPAYDEDDECFTMIDRAIADKGYKNVERFINEADGYLKPGGQLFIGFSTECGDLDQLELIAGRHGKKLSFYKEVAEANDDFSPFAFEIFQVE